MRIVLFAAALALAACGQPAPTTPPAVEESAAPAVAPPAPQETAAAETTDEPAPALAPAEPGTCIAYLKLSRAAAIADPTKGDVAALEAATVAWKRVARQKLNDTELAQFEASSLAVLRDTPPAALKVETDKCLAQAPKG